MKVVVQVINAFTDNGVGGNPAGVVLQAERFSPSQKQHIAANVGFSETAFVSPSQSADFKLEFFTPTKQIPHCGHATIATFGYLFQTGQITRDTSSKETIDGNRRIFFVGDMAFMEQRAPRYEAINAQEVLASLGITAEQLLDQHVPIIVNTGNSFALVPLRDETAVLSVHPKFDVIEQISSKHNLVGYYVFSRQTHVVGRDADARMFAPLYGIQEESATGMAAGPLACYLYDYLGVKRDRFVIEQGYLMSPRAPSELIAQLDLKNAKIEALMVGGKATVMRAIELEI
jgi:PhzF family phenazine biosynthesis protein